MAARTSSTLPQRLPLPGALQLLYSLLQVLVRCSAAPAAAAAVTAVMKRATTPPRCACGTPRPSSASTSCRSRPAPRCLPCWPRRGLGGAPPPRRCGAPSANTWSFGAVIKHAIGGLRVANTAGTPYSAHAAVDRTVDRGMLARADAVWGPLFGLAGCARAGQRAVARGKGKLRVALGATDWRLAVPRTDSH